MTFNTDFLIFSPQDVDLSLSPMRGQLNEETYVLGAFNPALTRLPNGNLLIVVRVAEALRHPVLDNKVRAIRWDPERGYVTDAYDLAGVDVTDPRKFRVLGHQSRVMALTSLSWLLPVELTPDGKAIVRAHYDKVIAPTREFQQYGIEDARISVVNGKWFMTTCSVSAERHSTTLHTSDDGLNYRLDGIILDHQNKDMLIFEGTVKGRFYALTRPMGDLYFAYPPESGFEPGPSINLAVSPDGLHWRPTDDPLIRPRRGSTSVLKVGGGTPPIRTPRGWLMLYHGVQPGTVVGVYRTFWALLDLENPNCILSIADDQPLLESSPDLVELLKESLYLTGVVFSTGIVEHPDGHQYIVASGAEDLACRITYIPKIVFQ